MIDYRPCQLTHLTSSRDIKLTKRYIEKIMHKYSGIREDTKAINSVVDTDFQKKRVLPLILLKMIIFIWFFYMPLHDWIFSRVEIADIKHGKGPNASRMTHLILKQADGLGTA